jgi:hypothetical protein
VVSDASGGVGASGGGTRGKGGHNFAFPRDAWRPMASPAGFRVREVPCKSSHRILTGLSLCHPCSGYYRLLTRAVLFIVQLSSIAAQQQCR